jgi:hypothetical protein
MQIKHIPSAGLIRFDNSNVNFLRNNAQGAIEDAAIVRQYTADPINPYPGQHWLLVTGTGQPIGLLLALTFGEAKFQFSIKTSEGPIIRVEMK